MTITDKLGKGQCGNSKCSAKHSVDRSVMAFRDNQIWVSAQCVECGSHWKEHYSMMGASFISSLGQPEDRSRSKPFISSCPSETL